MRAKGTYDLADYVSHRPQNIMLVLASMSIMTEVTSHNIHFATSQTEVGQQQASVKPCQGLSTQPFDRGEEAY